MKTLLTLFFSGVVLVCSFTVSEAMLFTTLQNSIVMDGQALAIDASIKTMLPSFEQTTLPVVTQVDSCFVPIGSRLIVVTYLGEVHILPEIDLGEFFITR